MKKLTLLLVICLSFAFTTTENKKDVKNSSKKVLNISSCYSSYMGELSAIDEEYYINSTFFGVYPGGMEFVEQIDDFLTDIAKEEYKACKKRYNE